MSLSLSLSLSLTGTFKHRLSVWLKFSVLALLAFTLLACGGGGGDTGGGDTGGGGTGVITKADQAALNQTGITTGNTINRFTSTSIPFTLIGGSGAGALSVSSSDENIATVTLTDTAGTLNLVGDGIVTITISKAGDDQYKAAEAITIALTIEYNPTNEFSYNPGSTTFGTSQSFAINSTNFDSETEEAPAAYSLNSVSWHTLDDTNTINTTTPAGISVDASTGTITVADSVNTGEYRLTVEAAFSSDNTTAQAIATITVNKAPIALSFNGGEQITFQNTLSDINLGDGATYLLTGNAGDGAVTFALEDNTANIGTVTAEGLFNPTADAEGSATLKVSVAATPNYLANDVDVTLLVTGKTEQESDVLTFVADPVTKLMTDDTFTRAATSTGVGDLSYRSSDETVATVNNAGVVTFVSAGTTTITAQLAGNETTASLSKNYQLTINKAPQAALVYDGDQGSVSLPATPITFTLTGGNGDGLLSITSSAPTVVKAELNEQKTGGTITPLAAGEATITFSKAGDDDYLAADDITASFTVTKSAQAALLYSGTQGSVGIVTETIDFTLTGGGDGTGAVSMVSSNTGVFTVTPNSDSTGGTITLVGEGSATLTLSKAGDDNYLPSGNTEVVFDVTKSDQAAISQTGLSSGTVNRHNTTSMTFTPSGGSGTGAFSARSSNANIATVTFNGTTGTVNLVGDGNVTITISKAGDAQYKAAEDLSITLTVENITLTPPLNVTATNKLNDTGITFGGRYPSGNNATCTSDSNGSATINAPQDCNQGRDALAEAGTLDKIGAGAAGFDFTKISSTGARLPAGATAWSCVLDNHTGLMWEVKTADGGLHDKNDTYTWYSTNAATNGGVTGTATHASKPNACEGYIANVEATYCNTQAFAARVNARVLCGANNWRLPSRNELISIVDYSRINPPIDTNYFPNTLSKNYLSTGQDTSESNLILAVEFSNGRLFSIGHSALSNVRLVRSGP